MNLDEFSKHLIERALIDLAEKTGTCAGTGAGKMCPVHGDADCNSSKQNRKEEWEGSKEDKGEDKKLAKKNKMSLSTWEKSAADKKHDMKKEETEKKETEKDEGGKHKEYKHAPGKEEKGEKKTEKEMKKEAKDYLPGNQEKLDVNKNGKLDADDFKKLRAKKGKTVKEMWQVAEGKKVEIEIMPNVDTPNDPEPPAGRKQTDDVKKKLKKEEFMPEELVGTTYEAVVETGETIIIEKVKMDGKDDNGFTSCWKGYKKAGTKVKGDKEVNNCVKAGYEMEGDEELSEKKLSAKETAKKEKFVKGMKKKFGAFKSKYGARAKDVMYGTATSMAKKAA